MTDAYGWGGQEKPGLFTLYKSQQRQLRIEGSFTVTDSDYRLRQSIDEQENAALSLRKSFDDQNKQRKCQDNKIYLSYLQNVKPRGQKISNSVENCGQVQNKMDSLTKILHLNIQQRNKITNIRQNETMMHHPGKKNGVKTQTDQKSNVSLSIEAIKQKYFKSKKCIDLVQHKKNTDYQVYRPKNQRGVVRNILKINDFFKINEKMEAQRHKLVDYQSVRKYQGNMNLFKYLVVGEKRPYFYPIKDRFSSDKQTKGLKFEPQTFYQKFLHRKRSPGVKFASQRLKSEGRVSDFRVSDDNRIQAYQALTNTVLRKPSKTIKHRKNISLLNGHHINPI